ncbi:PREDICTED: uncharacterized protein LOC108620848 [Drosophila arizonae]|uniref:Uncharacterized protein LOC108620848 n=1 Tax=Drosophila arizonae TaxID=7263 RepID=A0ABM1Q1J9_DROAR|nr:PREDICTED: uncharacterized protein LOC108620848 [Drosophila arizonae]
MAIDFLILALLLISFVINLLALCAFWITPGLRTTANRFTINLLIINLIGCCILAPTLFLSGIKSFSGQEQQLVGRNAAGDSIEFYSKPGNHQLTIRRHGQLVEQDGIVVRRNITTTNSSNDSSGDTIEMIYKCNATYCRELTIDERGDGGIVITETETQEDNLSVPVHSSFSLPVVQLRCWSIDMTAALGALAVLLVVGDTWCAVTDPLRYHSRISGVKTWVFITLTWAVGILFGALSAFRVLDFEADTLLSRHRRLAATYFNISSTNSIFGVIYACVYFIVIILLPFGFVCGMYWRIFSEARGNGLRMRQNGSSPLLQSALNLTNHAQAAPAANYTNSLCVHRHSISSASSHGGVTGGLQMQIDHRAPRSSPSCLRRDSAAKVLLPTISDDGSDVDVESNHGDMPLMSVPEQSLADRNQNILLTLQTASIGLLRGGKMLAEESPDYLRQQYNADSLEDVFLKLSVMQNMGKRRRSSIAQEIVEQVTVPAISNPALDMSDEQHAAEISGEFGDNISMSSAARDPISSTAPAAPPLPPVEEMKTSFWYNLHVMQSHHLHALIWKNFLWMMRNNNAVHSGSAGGADIAILLCDWP